MTIAELKKEIENLPDDMEVGSAGYFGELLVVYGSEVRDLIKSRLNKEKINVFCIYIEDAGPEPD